MLVLAIGIGCNFDYKGKLECDSLDGQWVVRSIGDNCYRDDKLPELYISFRQSSVLDVLKARDTITFFQNNILICRKIQSDITYSVQADTLIILETTLDTVFSDPMGFAANGTIETIRMQRSDCNGIVFYKNDDKCDKPWIELVKL
jgi:hypothetical protein